MAGTFPFLGISVWLIAKICILLALALYIIFAMVVIRQIRLMLDTVDMGFNLLIRIVGWGHLLFAIGITIIAFIIL